MKPFDEREPQRKRTSVRTAGAIAAGLLLIGSIYYGVTRPAQIDSAAGEVAPTFSLELLDGSGTLSSSELTGRPVVLNFWAGWCGPCRAEAPLLEAKWRQYRDRGLMVVGVMVRDTPESGLDFVERYDITYPTVWDPDQSLAREVGLVGLPQTFFIDADGRFVGTSMGTALGDQQGIAVLGPIEEDELDRQIEALLGVSDP